MRGSALLTATLIAFAAVPCGAQAPSATTSYAMLGRPAAVASSSPFAVVSELARLSAAEGRAFLRRQLSEPRVRAASDRVSTAVRERFERAGLPYPTDVLFRVFKRERIFEVWGFDPVVDRYVLVEEHPVCAVSGHLGPKSRRGDLQVPEGFYTIDLFNPRSRFHLSMRVNYPNASDRARGRFDESLGGDIFVHGGCATVGCVPVTDEVIEELYVLAMDARSNGQASIPIHIFPSRMEGDAMQDLWQHAGGDWSLWRFWLSLKAGYDLFQTHQRAPEITIDGAGFYRFDV